MRYNGAVHRCKMNYAKVYLCCLKAFTFKKINRILIKNNKTYRSVSELHLLKGELLKDETKQYVLLFKKSSHEAIFFPIAFQRVEERE